MQKAEAIKLLGGTVAAAAEAIGISYQAVDKWPDELPPRIADRVQAALWRMSQARDESSCEEIAHAKALLTGTDRRTSER